MTDVKIPIYDGLSYLPIYLAGTETNQDVKVTTLNFANESLTIPANPTIPSNVLEPRNGSNVRKFKPSLEGFKYTFEFPARNIQLEQLQLAISWKSLRTQVKIPGGNASPEIRLEIFHMRISSPLLPSIVLEGDLGLVFDLNGLQIEKSYFKRYEPDVNHLVPLDFKGFTSNNKFFNLQWKEPNINYWVRCLSPNLVDTSAPVDSDVSLRIVFGNPVKEIRLDWQVTGSAKTFTLPGLKLKTPELKTPDKEFFTLLIQADENQSLNNLALVLTLDAGRTLTTSSDFAWERNGDRELQGDAQEKDDKSKKDEPFLRLDVTTKKVRIQVRRYGD